MKNKTFIFKLIILLSVLTAVITLCSCFFGSENENGYYYGTPDPTAEPTPPPENKINPSSEEAGKGFKSGSKIAKYQNLSHGLKQFLLFSSENPSLPYNVACYIGETAVSAVLPSGVDLSSISVTVLSDEGDTYFYNGEPFESGKTLLDFSSPGVFVIQKNDGTQFELNITVENLNTGLPSVALTTDNYQSITSKTERISSLLYTGGGSAAICEYAASENVTVKCTAKGRGNSSWYWAFPKRSYTLKLDKKEDLLGMGKSKDYVLITCIRDRSLIRNYLMSEYGRIFEMDYCPDTRIVDFWLNGKYMGVYTLAEKIEISKASVDIPEDVPDNDPAKTGYLLEWDGHAQEVSEAQKKNWKKIGGFYYDSVTGNHLQNFGQYENMKKYWLTIKYPNENKITKAQCQYVYDFMISVLDALSKSDYDEACKYIDMESFAKWFIIEDLTENTDSLLWTSCWMYIDGNGKLHMGPLWDFDKSLGNNEYNPTKKYQENNKFYQYFLAMPEFCQLIKDTWAKYRLQVETLYGYIDSAVEMLSRAQAYDMELDDKLWASGNYHEKDFTFTTYEDQISDIKTFLSKRISYLDTFFNTLNAK